MMNIRPKPRRDASSFPLALIAAGVLLGTACDTNKLLQVTDPAVATPESLANPAALPTLYAGAIGDFQYAYSGNSDGNNEGIVTTTGVMTDELRNTDTFTTRIATDQRTQFPVQNGNTSDQAYANIQRARHSTMVTGAALAAVLPKDPRIAVMNSLEGASYVALGENFCGYIPFSDVVGGVTEFGDPLTSALVFAEAIKRFDSAIAVDATNNLPKVLKGRALLDNGDAAGAATAVASVPDNFVFMVEHSDNTGRQYNPMFSLAASNGRYSVADKEGGNGLPFMSQGDPRIPFNAQGTGFDKSTPLFGDLRYPVYGSPMPLATGVEARLIEAEAFLKTGDVTNWLAKLNGLRASFPTLVVKLQPDWANQIAKSPIAARTLAPLTDPGTADGRLMLTFSERAFWLYTTGHRLGDLRRLMRQYGKAQDAVFPTGVFFKSGNYGSDVAFPVPYNEQQNPKYHPEQCDVKKP
ncbi:MAG TPA: hypothetical protein VIJ45_03735 [Coriobacteriia bacterium]